MKCFVLLALAVSPAAAVVNLRKTDACAAEDLKRRAWLQNKIAGDCETMCKEVGAYPKCTCADFTYDKTPGVMTWDELLAHMDNLVEWGGPRGLLKEWQSQASSVLQQKTASVGGSDAKACAALDLHHRAQVQNKLATACEDMCKEVGAYPKCECPGFAPPDATPGVMTWEELNEHMDNLVSWGLDMLKKAKSRAGSFIQNQTKNASKAVAVAKNQTKNASKAVAVAKNQTSTKKQSPYGWGEALCSTMNTLSIFVSTDSAASWTAVKGSGCTSSSAAYTNIAVCGHGTVTYFLSEQGCKGNSATMQGATNGPDVNDGGCYTEKAVGFYSLSYAC